MENTLSIDRRFHEIYQRLYKVILNYLWLHFGESQNAADICQEAFIAAYLEFRKPDCRVENWGSWLKTVARNKAVDHLRAQKPAVSLESDNVVLESVAGRDHDETLAESLDARIKLCSLKHSLLDLPENEFWAVYLRDFKEFSFERVGDRLKFWRLITGQSPTEAARSLYRRGIGRLKTQTADWLKTNAYHEILACRKKCQLMAADNVEAYQKTTWEVIVKSIK